MQGKNFPTRATRRERPELEGTARSAGPASGVPSQGPCERSQRITSTRRSRGLPSTFRSRAGRPLRTELAGRCALCPQPLAPRSTARGLDALGLRRPAPPRPVPPHRPRHAPTGHAHTAVLRATAPLSGRWSVHHGPPKPHQTTVRDGACWGFTPRAAGGPALRAVSSAASGTRRVEGMD